MSAETIAQWNAIPMVRPDTDQAVSNSKRTRDEVDDSDDDMSLISRSPSPPSRDAMDIDKYDEYVHGAEREVITVETRISSSNKGFAMLAKLGWQEGQPLGLSGDGRVDPVPFILKNDLTGLGKTNQDVRMIESTVSQRRELDSERQTKETEDQRRAREISVAKRAAVQSEISTVLKAFYCELCDKQFQNVAQYDEHTNSYAHHHKARFRDMQAAQKVTFGSSQEELERRKEKERKREEKELRKIAKAAGIKMKPVVAGTPVLPPVQPPPPPPAAAPASESKPSGFKKSGWATVGPAASQTPQPPPPAPGPRHSGWASVSEPTHAPPPPPPPSANAPPPPPEPAYHAGPAPAFRTGGWTSLDTGSTMPPASSYPAAAAAPPPSFASGPPPPSSFAPGPPPQHQHSGWAPVPHSAPAPMPAPGPPMMSGGWAPIPHPSALAPPAPVPAPRQEASRSGWQQFKGSKGGSGSRRR